MRLISICLFCFVTPGFIFSQDSRVDVFGGYSYRNADTGGLTSRQNLNGWEVSISGSLNTWFALEGDVSGHYKTYDILGINVGVHDYFYGGGPRVNFRPVFVHALIGSDRVSAGAFGVGASQDSLAGAFGGGVQWKVYGPFSFRASADYLFSRHGVPLGQTSTQNNVRASAGIVYSFGGLHTAGPGPRLVPEMVQGVAIPSVGIAVKPGRIPGAEITAEAQRSAAELAGLRPGDVINAVDGKAVNTPVELAVELSTRAVGDKVRLGFMIHGQWQSEAVVQLQSH